MAQTNSLVKVKNETSQFLENNLPQGFLVSDIEYPNMPNQNQNNRPRLRCSWNNLGVFSTDASGCYSIIEGIFTIDVIYPRGVGDIAPLKTAEFLKESFESELFSDLVIVEAMVNPLPTEESFYIVQVNLNYQYEGFNNANYN